MAINHTSCSKFCIKQLLYVLRNMKLVVLKIARDCCRPLYKEKKPDIDIPPLRLLAKHTVKVNFIN